jgi:hypothetical protein
MKFAAIVSVETGSATDRFAARWLIEFRTEVAAEFVHLAQPIASSSSIMPAMTLRPPSQNFGSLASSPNGRSSSE